MKFTKFPVFMLVFCMTACSSSQLSNAVKDVMNTGVLSNAQIGNGLKEALEIGISKGASQLSQLDGYFDSPYKILLPPEARQITDKLSNVPGFKQVENEIVKRLNRGAEEAAKSAKPIFVNAIKSMSIADASKVLMGGQNAATTFLKDATSTQLTDAFNPVIQKSLDKFEARKYWADAVNAYNKIPFISKANPKLEEYVTQEALKGLFGMVEKEELNIRTNTAARTSDLLKKVFAKQDK